jgi:hypothetical protein
MSRLGKQTSPVVTAIKYRVSFVIREVLTIGGRITGRNQLDQGNRESQRKMGNSDLRNIWVSDTMAKSTSLRPLAEFPSSI